MEIRNCKFCKNLATYAPLHRMEVLGVKIYFCYTCQAEYLYFSHHGAINLEPTSISLYAVVKEKMYRWTYMAGGDIQLWRVKKPGIPGEKINEEMEPVAHFENMEFSSVNPINIQQKLEAWLPFL